MVQNSLWQPIETAPHINGKPLLFVSPAFGEYTVGTWDDDDWNMQCAPPRGPFTHWMPLPEPPHVYRDETGTIRP